MSKYILCCLILIYFVFLLNKTENLSQSWRNLEIKQIMKENFWDNQNSLTIIIGCKIAKPSTKALFFKVLFAVCLASTFLGRHAACLTNLFGCFGLQDSRGVHKKLGKVFQTKKADKFLLFSILLLFCSSLFNSRRSWEVFFYCNI